MTFGQANVYLRTLHCIIAVCKHCIVKFTCYIIEFLHVEFFDFGYFLKPRKSNVEFAKKPFSYFHWKIEI